MALVLIYGGDEKAKGMVTLKDLVAGAVGAAQLQKDRTQWRQLRPGQFEVARADLVRAVKDFAAS
jgi:histidyl-tRNA synthetase